jgi:hypothetical protein
MHISRICVITGLVLGVTATVARADGANFEVWLVDQSNSAGKAYGGAIHIYEGEDVMGTDASSAGPRATIDLGGATADLCLAATGARPVRPHMVLFNGAHSHAVLAFVASGHVVVFDGATRAPVACLITTPGAGGARQAHAAFPSEDDTYILVANQNGKKLERIDADYRTNTFTWAAEQLPLYGDCKTPHGVACELAGVRPDNAPICPILDRTGDLGFITLRGGGMFVINPRTMSILAEYDRDTVHGNGCGGIQAGGSMFMNSGGGTAANLAEFDVYRFPLEGYLASNEVNVPAPETVFSDDSGDRDAHGMTVTKDERYLWVLDRHDNVAEVFDVTSGAHVSTIDLVGPASADPAPDLVDINPAGNRLFVSLRGSVPLTGDPHSSKGTTPGLGIIELREGGRTGAVKAIARISNVGTDGVDQADAHGVRVRRK